MKKILLISIYTFFFIVVAHTQANLVLSAGSISTTNIKRGDHLKITFRVSNTGNATASKSHLKIYISPALSFTNAIVLSEISCEALTAGQQTQDINFIYPLPYNVSVGTNYILALVDSRNEVVETNESNGYSFASTVAVSSIYGGQQNLPYPVIFMHGLIGCDTTWYSFLRDVQSYYGFSYGGNFDFCLNQDGDESTAYLLTDVKDWTDTTQISKGDLYTVNFDVDRLGNKYWRPSKSNQSAIVKQGYAMSKVIKQVLAKTGKDKVILVGHSMGGLTCREYLQNSNRWQIDGKHHVAKLFTTGTPHGGSNSTQYGLGLCNGPDEKSEAVRDLRIDYKFGGNGVYLFGGVESYSNIQNNIIYNYHNVDVNCDGIDNSGNLIVGLNNKMIPTDLSYANVIGDDNDTYTTACSSCDGVVEKNSANLNNYKSSASADTFMLIDNSYSGTGIPPCPDLLHTREPKYTDYMFKGLDESNEYNTAYGIDISKTYFANFSVQSKAGYIYDYDDYKTQVPYNGILSLKLYNIPISKCYINLLDSSQTIIYKDSTNGQGYYEFTKKVSKGKYYVEFFCKPEETTWYYPYAFKTSFIKVDTFNYSGCNSYVYKGITYTNSITLKDTVKSIIAEDSVYNIRNINIIKFTPTTATQNLSGCNNVLYNAVNYTTSTVKRDTLRTSQGCDSVYKVANISITSITPNTTTVNLSGCNSVLYNGNIYNSSTIKKDTLKSYQGCDSVYKVANITIKNITPATQSINQSSCFSFIYKNVTYTSSAIIKDTLKTTEGCDSIYLTVNATVNPSISGRIYHLTKGAISNIKIIQSGTVANSYTASSVYVAPCINANSNITLHPTKNNDIAKANGVTSVDVLLTQRHILNTTKLNSAYKLIAADVDGNKAINSVDVLRMKRLILGTDTTFTSSTKGNRLWEFVDSAYQFPDTTNPFPFKDSISFTNLTSNKTNQTFIGVKLGDVNYDWNPAVARSVATKPVELVYEVSNSYRVQNPIRVKVVTNNFKDIAAMQYTLHFDNSKYEFVNLEGFKNLQGFDYNTSQANTSGNISFVWTDKNAVERSLEDGTELFTLVFTQKRIGNLELGISDAITETAAWDKDLNQHNIILTKRETTNEQQETRNEFFSVSPNPTSGEVKLTIVSKVNKAVNFELTDAQGKSILKQAAELQKGNNSFTLNLKQNGNLTTGIYFLKAIGVEGENVKRIIVK